MNIIKKNITLLLFNSLLIINSNAENIEFETILKSAHSGNPKDQYTIGTYYLSGKDEIKKSPSIAVNWFNKSAEQNYPKAQYIMGLLKKNGTGTKKSIKQAIIWFEKLEDKSPKARLELEKIAIILGKKDQACIRRSVRLTEDAWTLAYNEMKNYSKKESDFFKWNRARVLYETASKRINNISLSGCPSDYINIFSNYRSQLLSMALYRSQNRNAGLRVINVFATVATEGKIKNYREQTQINSRKLAQTWQNTVTVAAKYSIAIYSRGSYFP